MDNTIKWPFTRDWKNINNRPQDVSFFLQDVGEDLFIDLCSSVIQHIYVCLSGDAELHFSFEYRKKLMKPGMHFTEVNNELSSSFIIVVYLKIK